MAIEVERSISLRDLIRTRVREEVARHNARPSATFRGLVRPEGAETNEDGTYRVDRRRKVDWEAQAAAALAAFAKNGFFVVVGDRQVDDLDAELEVSETSEVAFVRLVPLVGG